MTNIYNMNSINNNENVASYAVPDEAVMSKIYLIRRQKVMLDKDLSELYGVENKRLKEQVRRNIGRFPEDFMFELSEEEYRQVKNSSTNLGRGELSKYRPFAFTEYGVVMLSTVLNSELAIKVNIQIIRVCVRIREMGMLQKDILERLDYMEDKLSEYDDKIIILFNLLEEFEKLGQEEAKIKNRPRIGFR